MCNSTTFALRHMQISLSWILRHFRPPSRHLLLNTHDTKMEFLQLSGPLLDIFLFFSKTKIFHSHPCIIQGQDHEKARASLIIMLQVLSQSRYNLYAVEIFEFVKTYSYSFVVQHDSYLRETTSLWCFLWKENEMLVSIQLAIDLSLLVVICL